MSVRIQASAPDLPRMLAQLKVLAADQIPFALSVGMNRSAKDAVWAARRRLPQVFDLRSRSLAGTFGPKGRMGDESRGWSNKRQWPDLRVTMFSEAESMALQETGGIKPRRAREVWIPTKFVPRTKTGKKPQRYQPARIKKRLASTRQRGGTRVFERGSTVFERRGLESNPVPIYLRRRRAVVSPALEFAETASDWFRAKLFPRFSQAMQGAVRTRR